MENGWVKYFGSGNPEYGTDQHIRSRLASWSRGRLQGMVAAELYHHEQCVIRINGAGVYHQSDDFEASIYQSTPIHTARRLQFKIRQQDKFVVGNLSRNKINAFLVGDEVCFSHRQYSLICSLHGLADQWLTTEYSIKDDEVLLYVSEDQL